VHHDRQPPAPGRQVTGCRDVAAEADEHVGLRAIENGGGRRDGTPHPAGDGQQLLGRLSRQRNGRNQLQLVAARRDDPGLEAALGAQAGDRNARIGTAELIGERHRWLDVATGSATSDDDAANH